jgi:thiamine biosynthesis lipoprotein
MTDTGKKGLARREALRITAVAGVGLALGGGLLASVLRQAGLHRARVTRVQLGTLVTITAVHPDPVAAREMVDAAFAEIERLEAILSRHRPDTPLARLNRYGVVGDAPPELTHVVGRALELGSLTAGAFDVTVGPLLAAYTSHFASEMGVERAESAPPEAEIRAALARVDYRTVVVRADEIRLGLAGSSLTLDGIAKGYVVDRAVATLTDAGAGRVIVDAGGDMAAGAMPGSEEPWRVAVQDPRSSGSLGTLELSGECVASSGDYMQAFTRDLRHHHIVDPRTGRSPDHTSGVTVVAPTAMDADALSTAAFVMGPRDGLALLEGLDGVEGLIVTKDQAQLRTRGFVRYSV